MKPSDTDQKKTAPRPRLPYEKPAVRTESLTAVAALCNGTTTGSRKAVSGPCNASKLKS